MKKSILATLALICFGMGATTVQAAEPITWSNVYLDAAMVESDDPSAVIGFEGGVVTENLDVYGFGEHNVTLNEQFYKVNAHYNILGDYSIYGQTSHFSGVDKVGNQFGDDTILLGVGYTGLKGANWVFKPFVGINHVYNNNGSVEDNVPMVGWSGSYSMNNGLLLTNWHETMINRDEELTFNGAFGVFKDVSKNFYVGAQYAYQQNTAAAMGGKYWDSVILRVGYHL